MSKNVLASIYRTRHSTRAGGKRKRSVEKTSRSLESLGKPPSDTVEALDAHPMHTISRRARQRGRKKKVGEKICVQTSSTKAVANTLTNECSSTEVVSRSGKVKRAKKSPSAPEAERGALLTTTSTTSKDVHVLEEIEHEVQEKPMTSADLDRVSVTGVGSKNPDLAPWRTFVDVQRGSPTGKLPAIVTDYMARWKGFVEPTTVQAHCWPIACAGRDVIGISKTGSGKTLAYILPGLSRILRIRASRAISFGPYVVVLSPTRELASQIEKESKALCRAMRVNSACLYGGAPKNEQIRALGVGPHLIVGCPGRIADFTTHADKFSGRTVLSLSMVTYLVLDEADCMLDLGFEVQIRKIFGHCSAERQTLFFSATWPRKVEALAAEFLKNPIRVQIGTSESSGAAGNCDVEQRILVLELDATGEASRQAKKTELWRILSEHGTQRCIVFCAMKKTAAVLAHQLKQDGFSVSGLHGDMPQLEREKAMHSFKVGDIEILVATDIAARGLDVSGIGAVINYDPAAQLDDHIHRIGRTSRKAGTRGVAYTLLGADDVRQARFIAESMRTAGHEVPAPLLEMASRRIDTSKSRKWAECWRPYEK